MTSSEPAYIEMSTKRGVKFVVDADERPKIRDLYFQACPTPRGEHYIVASRLTVDAAGNRRWSSTHIARLILGLVSGDRRVADHINGNPLDNRKLNLRACTYAENARNQRLRRDNKSGFKGVSQVSWNRWTAIIRPDGRNCCLGTFDSPEKAHQAYCEAAAWLYGEFANFGEDRSGDFQLAVRPASIPPRLLPKCRTLAAWPSGTRPRG